MCFVKLKKGGGKISTRTFRRFTGRRCLGVADAGQTLERARGATRGSRFRRREPGPELGGSPAAMSIRVEWPKEGIAVVVIDAPSTNNALSRDMLTGLAAAFRGLRADDATRVAVLTGGGSRAFCAGIDLKHADAVFKMDERDVDNDPVFQMEHASFPIVGAVRGFAINAGFELALACDVLLCAPCATFLDTHVKLGILPSWGLAAKLSRVIGPGAARRASLACRPVRADEARRLGLVVDVVDDQAQSDGTGAVDYGSPLMVEALSLAHAIARSSPASVAGYKKIAVDAFAAPLGAARREERARAFAQYRALPASFFAKMRSAAGMRPSAKL